MVAAAVLIAVLMVQEAAAVAAFCLALVVLAAIAYMTVVRVAVLAMREVTT